MTIEGTVIIHMKDIFSVMFMSPRSMRSCIMDMKGKRFRRMSVYIFNSFIREEVCHIFIQELGISIDADIGMLVSAASAEQNCPLVKSGAALHAVAHVPFADESHMVTGFMK